MKDTRQWIPRGICLVLVIGLLGFYQTRAVEWEKSQKENQSQLEAAQAYNDSVLAQREALAAASAQEDAEDSAAEALGPYQDGTYTGSAQGFGGEITVEVTISGGNLTDITVLDATGEDSAYFSMAEAVLDDMLSAQSAEVDTISGATFSSTGLRDAVAQALSQAEVS